MGKAWLSWPFSEQITLFKAAWCHLEKNVLSLLPRGCLKSFSILKSHLPSHGTPPLKTQTRKGWGNRWWTCQSLWLSVIWISLIYEKDWHQKSHTPSMVVSSCGPGGQALLPKGRLVFLESAWGSPFSGVGAPSEFCDDWGRNSQEDESVPVPSPFHPWIASHIWLLNHLNLRELQG